MFKRLLLVLVNGLVPLSLAAFKFAGASAAGLLHVWWVCGLTRDPAPCEPPLRWRPAFTLLVSAYLALLGVFRPYKEASTNVVAILTNYCQVLTAFGGAFTHKRCSVLPATLP